MIKTRFSKAINTYDRHAIAQNRIVKTLFDYIDKEKTYSTILEIGAGSGNLTKKVIELNKEMFYINDICPEIAEVITAKINRPDAVTYVIGDAETLDFKEEAKGKFDLVVSSSAFQWFNNMQSFFDKIYASLNDNGELVFSSFVQDNLKEVKAVTGVGLTYLSLEEMTHMLEKAGFHVIASKTENITLQFEKPLDVLKHIKRTGVNSISSQKWTLGRLTRFINEYENKFSAEHGVLLTYSPVYIKAIKKTE